MHLEKNVLALDWSKPKCAGCGNESEVTPGGVMFARTLSEVSINCPKCNQESLVPKAYAPDLVASRQLKIVIEIYGAKSSVRDAA